MNSSRLAPDALGALGSIILRETLRIVQSHDGATIDDVCQLSIGPLSATRQVVYRRLQRLKEVGLVSAWRDPHAGKSDRWQLRHYFNPMGIQAAYRILEELSGISVVDCQGPVIDPGSMKEE